MEGPWESHVRDGALGSHELTSLATGSLHHILLLLAEALSMATRLCNGGNAAGAAAAYRRNGRGGHVGQRFWRAQRGAGVIAAVRRVWKVKGGKLLGES